MTFKHRLANTLRTNPLLRFGWALGVRLFAPKNNVGAVAVIFNDTGQVLLAEHTFRPDHPWGLPGGWIERGENPVHAVQREIQEELNLKITVKKLLLCDTQGSDDEPTTPPSLGLAYYCRLDEPDVSPLPSIDSYEILSVAWVMPAAIEWPLAKLQQRAIRMGKAEFDREQPLG
jgi:ADP-ribose pyrophosphatase YjhB (NUDIX family)